MNDENVHTLKYREIKPLQGGAARPIADLFRLDGRTIVVTGAAGFLGIEVAIAILESGGHVLSMDLAAEPKPADWERVRAAAETNKGRAEYVTVDVTKEDRVQRAIADFTSQHAIRGLVACAGISDNGPAIDFPISSVRHLLDVNVTGTFIVAKAVAQQLQETGSSGSMIFIASISGHVSNRGVDTAGYNASKAALHQLARSLAAEWGSRVHMPLIRVNTISPGYIRTAATEEALRKPGMEEQWTTDNMMYRLSTVDEFRAPVLFLLGDGSSFVTGTDLKVDGGHCAW